MTVTCSCRVAGRTKKNWPLEMHCVYLYSYLKQNTTTKNKANEQNQKKTKKTPTSQKK